MVPSLMYVGSHGDHHRRGVYGTRNDPEYEPLAHWSAARLLASSLVVLAVPGLLVLRWGVLGPVSRLAPALRGVVVASMSTLVINVSYRRRPPRGRAARQWAFEEAGTAALVWLVAAAVLSGHVAGRWIAQWYCVGAGILVLNHLRTLAAHRYENQGEPIDEVGQLLDSVNVLGPGWLTALAAPVGLRFHALHHLAPTLPYHALGAVHRRLAAELPADAPYRRTGSPGMRAALRRLVFERPAPQPVSAALAPAAAGGSPASRGRAGAGAAAR
jgi:hypothetical protein